MLLDNIYKKVKTFVNTDVYGSVTPVEFERFVHDAIQERNEDYFYEFNKLQTRANRGMIIGGLANLPDRYSEKILHYQEQSDPILIVLGKIAIPDNVRYLDELEYANSITYEFCKDKKTFNILKSQATLQYPIYTIIGPNILVSPFEAETSITLTYLRKVRYPKWTYNLISGVEVFNPSATDFVDADIHPSEENEIVRRVLLGFGVNLKEEDLREFTLNQEKMDFTENNAT